MTRPCQECADQGVLGCQCSLEGSETVAVTGSGSPGDPFTPSVILDPDGDNLLTEGIDGLAYFASVALERMLDPARGILYRTTTDNVPAGTLHLLYDNSDVAGGMTTDAAKAYLITPYAGVYIATCYVRLAALVAGTDPSAVICRIYDEDSNGEVAAGMITATSWFAGSDPTETVVVATSTANLAAARRITTSIGSNTTGNDLHAGDNTEYAAKFTLNYLGPAM